MIDPALINHITGLSMQGPDPQDYYPRKTTDRALSQKIKEAYENVEKGAQGYKVTFIDSGAVRLAYQMITGKVVHKNRSTQVSWFVVDLTGKCVGGVQMNWSKYLVDQLELDCREVQDQGYEFHFSWLLILVAFIAWEMSEDVVFPETLPFEPLAAKFSTLWYTTDMNKKWKLNTLFHRYYIQLKTAIQATPHITPNRLHIFRPLMKFSADRHFIYLTPRADEHQEQLQSYYKLTEEYLEDINKEWSTNLLVATNPANILDISSLEAAQDTLGPSKMQKTKEMKKNEEVQDVDSRSVRTASVTPDEEGNDEDLEEVKQQPEDNVKF
jgi:hypothetical protein